ncbi:MAG: hypothetical protein NTX28_06640 [Novosphingobium sp.]|nr:hypothetical protein [Novosphingobium sp.]
MAFAEQGCRANRADGQDKGIDDFNPDGAGQPLPFFKPGFGVRAEAPSPLLDVRENDDGARATGDFTGNLAGVVAEFKSAQESSPSQSPVRST